MARKKQESEYQMSKVEGVGAPSTERVILKGKEATAYLTEKRALAEKPEEARLLAFKAYQLPADYSPVGNNDIADALGQIRSVSRGKGMTSVLPKFFSGAELMGAIDAYWDFIYRVNADGRKIYPDVEGLASFLRVSRTTLMRWRTGETNREFAPIIETTLNDIASVKKQLALGGNLPRGQGGRDLRHPHGKRGL